MKESNELFLNELNDKIINKIPFEKNNVLTVEPGIYIMEEEFGIRLEDDVVINDSGNPTNLMSDIPIEIEEIEDLMNKHY